MTRRFTVSLIAALILNFAGTVAFGMAFTPQPPPLKTIAYVVAHR
jgi:hypothetical protein